MNTYNELIEALTTIKTECRAHSGNGGLCGCTSCPLAVDDYQCGITGLRMVGVHDYKVKPMYWDIPKIRLIKKKEEK